MNHKTPWNKGLTKQTDKRIIEIGLKVSKKLKGKPGKKLDKNIKQKISQSMKKAHQEQRAYNIGLNKHNNLPSYPEQFFTKVIENEFEDKNYESEYVIGKFRIDFAWLHKKLAIEIDGQQHEKEEHKLRDIKKDQYLKEKGWQILRIKWIDLYNEPQKYIDIAKKFIHEDYLNYCYEHFYEIYDSFQCHIDLISLKQLFSKIKNKGISKRIIQQRLENKIKKDQFFNQRIQLILNSNVNFSKYGWIQQISEILNINPQKVVPWMKRNMYNFWNENCFKRNTNMES